MKHRKCLMIELHLKSSHPAKAIKTFSLVGYKVLDVPMIDFFKKNNPEANFYDKNILEKVKLIEEFEEPQKNPCSLLLIQPSLRKGSEIL